MFRPGGVPEKKNGAAASNRSAVFGIDLKEVSVIGTPGILCWTELEIAAPQTPGFRFQLPLISSRPKPDPPD